MNTAPKAAAWWQFLLAALAVGALFYGMSGRALTGVSGAAVFLVSCYFYKRRNP